MFDILNRKSEFINASIFVLILLELALKVYQKHF